MGWSLCVTKELVQSQSLSRWPKTKVGGKGAWEVGQFQVSDKIQDVSWDWEAEVGEVVLRVEEDQEQRAQGDGWVAHVEAETAWKNEGSGCRARREPGVKLQGRRRSGQEARK